uniref:translocating chain-associated membrane protein 1 n=1 Tax=Myxine glutinosa TaxID=7769 RepID=UPI00358F7FE5
MVLKKKNKNPAVFSHEFFIQNHADIMSCVAMLVIIGLMFEATADVAFSFITLQHNVTEDGTEGVTLYQYGRKDLAAVVFYSVIAVVLHAVLQEYGLDKMNRRLHLSKTKQSKFNESGQLGLFYCISFFWGAYLLSLEDYISQPSGLWEGYPHTNMSSHVKFFFICQIAYWLHALPELYFQKIKKEDIPRRLQYITLYLAHITAAYLLNLHRLGLVLMVLHFLVELIFHASRLLYYICEAQQHGFKLWAVFFVVARLVTLTLSVLTLGFGLGRAENQGVDVAAGNFNTLLIRWSALVAMCLTQAWMMWHFINFHLRRWRETLDSSEGWAKRSNGRSRQGRKGSDQENGNVKAAGSPAPRSKKRKLLSLQE